MANDKLRTTDMQGRPAWVQRMERCKHFNGVLSKVCEAGVTYDDLLDGDHRLPCIRLTSTKPAAVCSLETHLTEEEAKAEQAESDKALADYVGCLARKECPHCHKPIAKEKQVGRCVYAEPCGHRLYQGRVSRG